MRKCIPKVLSSEISNDEFGVAISIRIPQNTILRQTAQIKRSLQNVLLEECCQALCQ